MNPSEQTNESSPNFAWRLSDQHQLAIALLGTLALLVAGLSYAGSAWQGNQGDIDRAQALPRTFQVDINGAELGELMAVPNIGPTMAKAIIDHREGDGEQQGLFASLEELQNVPGIGPAKFEQLKKFLLPID